MSHLLDEAAAALNEIASLGLGEDMHMSDAPQKGEIDDIEIVLSDSEERPRQDVPMPPQPKTNRQRGRKNKVNLDNKKARETDSESPSLEPEDSRVDHDMDAPSKGIREFQTAMTYLRKSEASDEIAKDVGRPQTEQTGLNETLGRDQVDRKRPAWLFAPETRSLNCVLSTMPDFTNHIGPTEEKFEYRLTIDSGHYLATPAVVMEVFDRTVDQSTSANKDDDGLRFQVKYEPGVVSSIPSAQEDGGDQLMQGSDHAADGDRNQWEIDTFKMELLEQLWVDNPETFENVVKAVPAVQDTLDKWAYITMSVHGGRVYKIFPEYKEFPNVSKQLLSLKVSADQPDLQFLVEVGHKAKGWFAEV